MEEYRVMIAGSRSFKDYLYAEKMIKEELVKRGISKYNHDIIIISGGADGADKMGEIFAGLNCLKKEVYKAEWDNLEAEPCKIKYNSYGKPYNCLAGFNRNTTMIDISDLIILFWDGSSKGTLDDINKCKAKNKDYVLIKYN